MEINERENLETMEHSIKKQTIETNGKRNGQRKKILRWHSNSTIQTNIVTIDVRIFNDTLCHSGEIIG